MTESHRDFNCLVEQDGEAKRYFESLPYAMKQTVQASTDKIHSFEALRDCVESKLNQNISIM